MLTYKTEMLGDVMNNQINDEILINRMFRGEYLAGNIGHEIINLFKADDDKNYIYINPYGDFAKKHRNRIKTILLVRNYAKGTFEILAKATDLELLIDDEVNTRSNTDIRYGGVPIWSIFDQNNDHIRQAIVVTFRAGSFHKAKKRILITESARKAESGEYIISLSDHAPETKQVHLPKQSLKAYYSENDSKTGYVYKKLQDAINDIERKDLWEKDNTTKGVLEEQPQDEHYSFLKLIRKEDDELCFSNMFAHFLGGDFRLYRAFATEVLKLQPEKVGSSCTIYREKDNIDLLIDDGINRIIIENKIHSLINGLKKEQEDQIESQLSKYWKNEEKKVEEEVKNGGQRKKLSAFLFLPKYNEQYFKMENYDEGMHYIKITYEQLYEFFSKQKKDIPYYTDFCNALYKHSLEVREDLYQENLEKFLNIIKSINCRNNG